MLTSLYCDVQSATEGNFHNAILIDATIALLLQVINGQIPIFTYSLLTTLQTLGHTKATDQVSNATILLHEGHPEDFAVAVLDDGSQITGGVHQSVRETPAFRPGRDSTAVQTAPVPALLSKSYLAPRIPIPVRPLDQRTETVMDALNDALRPHPPSGMSATETALASSALQGEVVDAHILTFSQTSESTLALPYTLALPQTLASP